MATGGAAVGASVVATAGTGDAVCTGGGGASIDGEATSATASAAAGCASTAVSGVLGAYLTDGVAAAGTVDTGGFGGITTAAGGRTTV